MCQDSGASTVFIHGRTAAQGYRGQVNYEPIKAAKLALKIPVFGSGNIFDPFMAKKMIDQTQCDGILVARGAYGNPWIFKDIENYLKNRKLPCKMKIQKRKAVLKDHIKLINKYKDISDKNKIGFMGKVSMWYLKGIYDAKKIRDKLHRVKNYQGLLNIIEGIK